MSAELGQRGRPTQTSNNRLPLRGVCCLPVIWDVEAENNLQRNCL